VASNAPDKQQNRRVLQRINRMHVISKADLHIHTTHSDGVASVSEVLQQVAESDLSLIAITDHDTIAGAREARRLARSFGVEVIMGEEVTTQEGHLLALFIEDELPPGRPAAHTIAAVHAQGGLCIAPHPYDWAVISLGRWGLRERYGHDWQFDAIEVFNGSLSGPRRSCNARAQQIAAALGAPTVGGSDSHSLATIGRGYTTFAGSSADDLYRAIKRGDVGWGGAVWTTAQYADLAWRSVKQRSLRGALTLLVTDLPWLRPAPSVLPPTVDTPQQTF
jgi:predicted metal-dependent phosphoesterase TrpH